MEVTISSKTKAQLYPKKTPVSDKLMKQNPPEGCSKEQWMTYVAAVRSNELSGISNPVFGIQKPWEKCGCIRNVRRLG